MGTPVTKEWIKSFLDLIRFQHQETDFHRIPLAAEKSLLGKIRRGEKIVQVASFEQIEDNMGNMVIGKKKNYEYNTVAAITLMCRTAIEAGVRPDDAFDLSDALLLALSGTESIDEIHNIFELAASMFAEQVHNLPDKKSYAVNQAISYISHNIFGKLTLSEIAQYVGLTPNYLCAIFSKEMGLSIYQYIQQEKIKVAVNLLIHTDQQIKVIATHLGFESQSNFTEVFKKWRGISPKEYRNQYQKDVF